MLSGFVLSLREGLEAALILGIVLGALQKVRQLKFSAMVWSGALSAIVISLVAALILHGLGAELEGRTEEIFEGITMLLAASVLTWMIVWMRHQSRGLKGELEGSVQRAISGSGPQALFLLAFMAVLREGVELALFITAAILETGAGQVLPGMLLGLGTAVFLGWSLFASIVRLDLRRFFQVTGVLLVLFAAGLIAHSVHALNEARLVPTVIDHVWDLNPLVNGQSALGQGLSTLFGYNGTPSLTEVLAYLGYFALIAAVVLVKKPAVVSARPKG